MDHVVYLDSKANELENIISGKKTIIVRGASGRKLPYDRVSKGDVLYLIENKGDGLVKASAVVSKIFQSEKQTPSESEKMLKKNQDKTCLNENLIKRFSKRYLILIYITKVKKIHPFKIDRSNFNNMDDWLPVEKISLVKSS